MLCEVVGKIERSYPDKETGELKTYRALHVVWDASKKENGLLGRSVQEVRIPFQVDLDKVQVGQPCRIEFGDFRGYSRVVLVEPAKP